MTERRKITRLDCRLPLNIIQVGSDPTDRREHTVNVSSNGGVCFHSNHPLTAGERVQYCLTLSQNGPEDIRLICAGAVVRCRPIGPGPEELFEIAMTMQRYRFVRPSLAEFSANVAPENIPARSPGVAQTTR